MNPRKLMAAKVDSLTLQPAGIPKERYIPPEKREKKFDDLRL